MSDSKIHGKHAALRAKTIQMRPMRAELHTGRRWKWCGRWGWWLHCTLLHEQRGIWDVRRFVTNLDEACALLNIDADDWTWQPVLTEEVGDKESLWREYTPFLMF